VSITTTCEHELTAVKNHRGAKLDTDLDTEGLKEGRAALQARLPPAGRRRFPAGPVHAARGRHRGRLQELDGRRAIKYRELNDIRGLRGTAVNVQSMVFGNMGDDSADRRRVHA
jgi:pyruvate,orthophosphate dikinase